jgi:cytochrome c5
MYGSMSFPGLRVERCAFSKMSMQLITTIFLAVAVAVAHEEAWGQGDERSGKQVVEAVCLACHGSGANGAPKIGDKKAWDKRASQGLPGLTKNALKGIRQMPSHGGNPSLTDLEIERAITYMVNQSGGHWIEPIDRAGARGERGAEQIVRTQCVKCHEDGVGGAPRIGDRTAWIPRLKQGVDSLVRSAINGHGGMPPRGGMANLTDSELRSAIVYMFNPVTAVAPTSVPASAATGQDFAVVDGTTVYFGVVSADAIRDRPKDYPQSVYGVAPNGPAQYYVTIALFEGANGKRIDDAVVKARVSATTGAGPEKTLAPVTIAGSRSYGNYFTMGGTGPYKITVQVKRPGAANVIQAQFEYAHP